MTKVYVVQMFRWGDMDEHSYIAGVFTKWHAAKKAAITARENRGGKYEWVIDAFYLDTAYYEARPYHKRRAKSEKMEAQTSKESKRILDSIKEEEFPGLNLGQIKEELKKRRTAQSGKQQLPEDLKKKIKEGVTLTAEDVGRIQESLIKKKKS